MATLHSVGECVLICASSKVFSAHISSGGLSIKNVIDVKEVSDSLPFPEKEADNGKGSESDTKKTREVVDFQILCSKVSNCSSLLAVATSAKTVLLLDLPSLSFRRGFRIPKAPTSLVFDRDNTHVVVGDRAGHVCRYTVGAAEKFGYTDMNGITSLHEGEPLSSAITMVLDVALSEDGKFLLIADRDEKIRVSRYPEAYVVQSFCLGHSAYVSSVALRRGRFFSSGGDGVVHEWAMESGTSVAHSDRLGEGPIRRIRVLEKEDGLCIVAITGSTLLLLDGELKCIKTFKTSDPLMDIALSDGAVVAVTCSGLVLFNVSDGTFSSLQVPNELVDALTASKDPISNYFKNVTHQNMVEYYKRKAEKIESTKENQMRKRKAKQSLERTKKIATGAEATAS
ncbi:unnamed protein product [Heligmosomoides polygyrus]|uniref:tRNA (guanine-N(7)-)-methyltransferase non-catalytic subunit n=1 Tax=Heligmosomoides polygyrus TaxID=6339 RepID=A0A3P7ZVQ0_HELPZ|nr:unnamed protein product [Heligmosomoides polygyrus]